MSSRQNVRETLVVLEKEDDVPDQADYVLSDRTSRRRNNGNPLSSSNPADDARETDNNLTAWMQSTAGQAAFASAASHLTSSFQRQSETSGSLLLPVESLLSPVESAFAATEAEIQALSIVRSKTWSVLELAPYAFPLSGS